MDILTLCLLLLSIIASYLPSVSSVRCYVCSWSSRDEYNRTDWCTSEHFEPRVVFFHECELGCETYVQWDKNEVLEHWRRNCVQEGTIVSNGCKQEEDRARIWRKCACNSDLCNGAISVELSSVLPSWLLVSSLYLIKQLY